MEKLNLELTVNLNNRNTTNFFTSWRCESQTNEQKHGFLPWFEASCSYPFTPVRIPSAVTVTSHQQRNRNYALERIRLTLLFCHYKPHKGSFSSASRHWGSIHACFQGNSIEYAICPRFVWNDGLAENEAEKSMILCRMTPTHSLPLYPGPICLLLL